ncbi:MAG: hypothetical protein DHS20C15_27500 [Planctomycetota bacterium]|nr:MAG: hypothetical protein DHS20C15_27500 [Planctomycetota bacterium]
MLASEVEWNQLNPARGDASPRAGTLWGDRQGTGPTGFLFNPVDGFSSPPHIHNVSYRGVVIEGLVHNDDPEAAEMWMPAGSFWTQPAGELHITAAKGPRTLAYIEIDEGPYLVLPKEQAADNGERAINVHASNLVWLDVADPTGAASPPESATAPRAKIAFLWGSPGAGQLSGALLKLPAGFTGELRSNDATLRAVVIQGRPRHATAGARDPQDLEPGSYFVSTGDAVHELESGEGGECILYVRAEGGFELVGW